jgi:hypothetical protein
MTDSKKRAEIVSSFTDHGTGESFTANTTPLIDAGAFANYEAAGLVRAPSSAPKAASKPKSATKPKPSKSKTGRKSASRAKAPTPAPVIPAVPAAPASGEGGASA